ncbi:MAG: VOC family protein [Acidimicrobiales bacterium]
MERLHDSTFTDLDDWRVLLGRIEATFRAGSFPAASSLVAQIVEAAEAADHHPDIDVRFPDRVRVAVTSHDAGGLTDLDRALATTISELAAAAGATSEPTVATRVDIAIDAMDIDTVLPFWRAVLGYRHEESYSPAGGASAVVDPLGISPPVWFQQMDEPRLQRNRIHIDVTVPHDEADARISAALAAGGQMVSDRAARAFWVLADPEGNEACICTWEDRG